MYRIGVRNKPSGRGSLIDELRKLREWQDPPLQASHLQGLTTSWQAFVRDLFGYGGIIR